MWYLVKGLSEIHDDHISLLLTTIPSTIQVAYHIMVEMDQLGFARPLFKKIMGRTEFSYQFRKIIIRHKHIGYGLNVMRQSACLVINPITVDGFAALFNCTPVDRASDSLMTPT